MLKYLDELDAAYENDIITVVVPEFVLGRWWQQFLHNQSALALKGGLLFRRNTVVTSVPFHLTGPRADSSGDAGFNEPDILSPDAPRPSGPKRTRPRRDRIPACPPTERNLAPTTGPAGPDPSVRTLAGRRQQPCR